MWAEASNRPELRWLTTVVVSVGEKASERRQVGIRKASVSESLLKCRKVSDGIKTGASSRLRDKSGGSPPIGQAVPGMQTTRA